MTLRQKLEHRQAPVFTQSLTQSVKILELPLLELKNTVEAELVENPVVEEIPGERPTAASKEEEPPLPEEDGPLPFEKEEPPSELANYEKPIPGKKETLSDALLRQLRINAQGETQTKIGMHLINQIDENGYLRQDPASASQELGCGEEEILEAIKLIQTFDPAGVGSRDLKECLLIQVRKRNETDPLLLRLIENHLQDLASGDVNKLCKKLKCEKEALARCLEKIRHLEPKPGRAYASEDVAYVTPDITVEEKDGELSISTKDDSIPTLRINPLYKNMLKSKKVNETTKEFIRERLARANNLIRAIESRRKTLLRVVSVIAEIQREAFLEGLDKIRPLTFREVAERVEMHESTISRVVMHKYIQAPTGIFRLKDFFSGSLKTAAGDPVSSQSIKQKIEELVENEDKSQPLRDQEIADLLKESEKIPIARRTVAKYRELLKIPPVSDRRKLT